MKLTSDDLLVILALCRERTLDRAGRFLDRDVSSVFRAIKRIGTKAGAPLFSRSKTGFHPFPAAEELAEQGREISEALSQAEAICSGLDDQLSGRLRITTTDLLLEHFILPNLAGFRREFPNVDIDFSTSNQFAKLWERGFDLAVRPSANPPEQLMVQFLRRLEYAVVRGRGYKPAQGTGSGAEFDWLVPGSGLAQHPVRKWFARNAAACASVTSFDSMSLMIQAVRADLGVSLVPDLPALTDGLVRMDGLEVSEFSEIWCLYHPSNRGNPLIQAFSKFMKRTLN
ncbi:LysR family transcriptional regulator [Leisingera sp. F5]|uniref:LysR family transcriptional regulator n=1 Tax=Leisingera sp. F5 TaxID=1813816 RepID=UPI000B0CAB70|nr:LysR family transcriptional regulator [Leisingera sp. F5]